MMQPQSLHIVAAIPEISARQIAQSCLASIAYITSITFIARLTVTASTLSNDGISVSQVRLDHTDTAPEHELMAIDSALVGL